MGKNYPSISSMEKFSFISCVYLYIKKEVNSIPSESWLDRAGEKDRSRSDMYVCWCTWFSRCLVHEWEGEGGRVGGSWVRQVTTPVSRSIITASSTLCVRWEGVDGEVRVCEGVRV